MPLSEQPRFQHLVNHCRKLGIAIEVKAAGINNCGDPYPESLSLIKPNRFKVYQEDVEHACAWINGYTQAMTEVRYATHQKRQED